MIVLEVVITSLNLLRKTMKNLSQVSKLLACNQVLYILPYIEASCKCMLIACHGCSSYSKMGSLRFTSIFSAFKICNYM